MHCRAHILVKNNLRHAISVAQVNEDDAAVIATAMHPTHQHSMFAFIGGAQLSARVRPLEAA